MAHGTTGQVAEAATDLSGSRPIAQEPACYKLLDSLSERWRRVNGHELVAEVLDGATFKDGIKLEETDYDEQDERVAA